MLQLQSMIFLTKNVAPYEKINCLVSENNISLYEVSHIDSKEKFMMREIVIKVIGESYRKQIYNEVMFLTKVKHPLLLELTDFYKVQTHKILLLFKWPVNGSLRGFLEKHQLTDKIVKKWIIQLCFGMKFIHEHKLILRNLSLSSLYLDEELNLLLTNTSEITRPNRSLFNMINQDDAYLYSSPEVISWNKYSYKSDIWALGVVLHEIVYRVYPFCNHTREDLNTSIIFSEAIKPAAEPMPGIKNFLDKILVKDPEKRPTIQALVVDNYFQGICREHPETYARYHLKVEEKPKKLILNDIKENSVKVFRYSHFKNRFNKKKDVRQILLPKSYPFCLETDDDHNSKANNSYIEAVNSETNPKAGNAINESNLGYSSSIYVLSDSSLSEDERSNKFPLKNMVNTDITTYLKSKRRKIRFQLNARNFKRQAKNSEAKFRDKSEAYSKKITEDLHTGKVDFLLDNSPKQDPPESISLNGIMREHLCKKNQKRPPTNNDSKEDTSKTLEKDYQYFLNRGFNTPQTNDISDYKANFLMVKSVKKDQSRETDSHKSTLYNRSSKVNSINFNSQTKTGYGNLRLKNYKVLKSRFNTSLHSTEKASTQVKGMVFDKRSKTSSVTKPPKTLQNIPNLTTHAISAEGTIENRVRRFEILQHKLKQQAVGLKVANEFKIASKENSIFKFCTLNRNFNSQERRDQESSPIVTQFIPSLKKRIAHANSIKTENDLFKTEFQLKQLFKDRYDSIISEMKEFIQSLEKSRADAMLRDKELFHSQIYRYSGDQLKCNNDRRYDIFRLAYFKLEKTPHLNI